MDRYLLEKTSGVTPPINSDIANGIAIKHMAATERYIDDILSNVSRDFPDGLQYVNCQRCTPQEEFAEVTRKKGGVQTFDLARSDIYLMRYNFTFKGERLPPRYVFLPFLTERSGGGMMLSGSRFFISPVLSDKVISVAIREVFVRLLRAKLRFYRIAQNIMVNGHRDTVQVAWSEIYNKNAEMKKLKSPVKAFTCAAHYLFCKYGFTQTFQKYANCTPVVGYEDISPENYPPDQWVICESFCAAFKTKPKGAQRGPYKQTRIRVAIRQNEFSAMAKSLVAGFFYVVDYFPGRIVPEYVDRTNVWKVLMGLILFTDAYSEGKLQDDIDKHLRSLDRYIDRLIEVKLKEIGYDVPDVYQLFAIVIENITMWMLKSEDTINSMYNKELSVLYDVLYDITTSIFETLFKLRAVTNKELTAQEVVKIMNKHFRVRGIFSIIKQRKGVSPVSSSGDNKYFKITSVLVAQSSGSGGGGRREKKSVDDPQFRLHASVAEVGSLIFLPKPDPSGHGRINPWVKVDANANIVRNEDLRTLIDDVQERIAGRIKKGTEDELSDELYDRPERDGSDGDDASVLDE